MSDGIVQGKGGPTAINSKLGWLLSGPTQTSSRDCKAISNVVVTGGMMDMSDSTDETDLTTVLRRFWDTEAIGIQKSTTESLAVDDQTFLRDIRHEEGHYTVSLPWIKDSSEFPSHHCLSLNRLKYLQMRLLRRPELLTEYSNILQEQLCKGIIEKVRANEINAPAHYMPHHAVIREDKQTTRLQIVYDGSARTNGEGLSLNDCLQTGPNLIPKLFDILLRFRLHSIALVADIEKAF